MEMTSCLPGEPLSRLDTDGQASVLNYNLPQSTTYDVQSLLRLDIPRKAFKDAELEVPRGNYWDRLDGEYKEGLNANAVERVLAGQTYSAVKEVQSLGLNLTASVAQVDQGVKFKAANLPVASQQTDFGQTYLANKIAEGFRPVLYRRPSGKQGLRFAPRPQAVTPTIFIVLHMRMASYLGDYGAGQTLSTLSLLPGERREITVVDYRSVTETATSSQSVLDSYSESAMDDLQTTIEERTEQNESASETDTDSMSADVEASGGLNLGIVSFGGEAGASASSVNTTTEAVSSQVETLNSAVSHHVQTADTQRQVEIKTDTTTTETTETTTTTNRVLENINRSRVLNFVFRQLLQEYYTITYLDNVSFYYSNGYDNSVRRGTLGSLDAFLADVLRDKAAVEKVRNDIFVHLCAIPDHNGTKVSFIEKVTEKFENCINPGAGERNVSYVRKRKGLKQAYRNTTVPGIILDVSDRVLRTPAVMVDAMLGQGESLDCYNMNLQEASWEAAHLSNEKTRQAMAILDGVDDPEERARLYNAVFGTCCGTGTPGEVEPASEPAEA